MIEKTVRATIEVEFSIIETEDDKIPMDKIRNYGELVKQVETSLIEDGWDVPKIVEMEITGVKTIEEGEDVE